MQETYNSSSEKEKALKKIVSIVTSIALASMLCIGATACNSKKAEENNGGNTPAEQNEPSYIDSVEEDDVYASGIHHAKVTVDGYKAFTIELDANTAPITVSNFCKLSNEGFYDGLTFHRVIDEFCLQGGDPNGNGTGDAGQDILGEFSNNGVANKLADNYKNGVVAMARAQDPNSASCQFFITLSDINVGSLNGLYAAFGTIDKKGMKTVDKIVADTLASAKVDGNGTITKRDQQPVIKSIKIVD